MASIIHTKKATSGEKCIAANSDIYKGHLEKEKINADNLIRNNAVRIQANEY